MRTGKTISAAIQSGDLDEYITQYVAQHRKVRIAEGFPTTVEEHKPFIKRIDEALTNLNPAGSNHGDIKLETDQTVVAFRRHRWTIREVEVASMRVLLGTPKRGDFGILLTAS